MDGADPAGSVREDRGGGGATSERPRCTPNLVVGGLGQWGLFRRSLPARIRVSGLRRMRLQARGDGSVSAVGTTSPWQACSAGCGCSQGPGTSGGPWRAEGLCARGLEGCGQKVEGTVPRAHTSSPRGLCHVWGLPLLAELAVPPSSPGEHHRGVSFSSGWAGAWPSRPQRDARQGLLRASRSATWASPWENLPGTPHGALCSEPPGFLGA